MIKIPKGMSKEGASLLADADEGLISWASVEARLSSKDVALFYGAEAAAKHKSEPEAVELSAESEAGDMAELLDQVLKDLGQ